MNYTGTGIDGTTLFHCSLLMSWIINSRDELIQQQRADPKLGCIHQYLTDPKSMPED